MQKEALLFVPIKEIHRFSPDRAAGGIRVVCSGQSKRKHVLRDSKEHAHVNDQRD